MIAIREGSVSSCHGATQQTLAALTAGKQGTTSLLDCAGLDIPGVDVVYADPAIVAPYAQRAEKHLLRALAEIVHGSDPAGIGSTGVIVCTGLSTAATVEQNSGRPLIACVEQFYADRFGVVPAMYSITNACSASGMGVALAVDLLTTGIHQEMIVVGADSMTRSMLTMIGKVAAQGAATSCTPFDQHRRGAVLGEGAAACRLALGEQPRPEDLGRLLSIEVSTDAAHLTAPDLENIVATVERALASAGRDMSSIDVAVPHGTGTEMNDRTEVDVYRRWATDLETVVMCPLKGDLGHTSGASFLMSTVLALAFLRGSTPPNCTPNVPMDGTEGFRWSNGEPLSPSAEHALVSAYGFGGVNAVGVVSR